MHYLLVILLFLPLPATAQWYRDARDMMGTRVELELWADSEAQGQAAITAGMAEMDEVNRLMNPWDADSEISRVNREGHTGPVPVSPPFFEVVERALYYSRLSDGAFDISFASAGQHYDYRREQAPDADTLAQAVERIDYRAIRLDPATGQSSGAVQSASVLTARAMDSDALSTTTFVLGVEKGLALINSLPGVDAIIIDGKGLLHYSDGLLREAEP